MSYLCCLKQKGELEVMPTALLCRGVAIGEPRECVLGAVFSLLHFVRYDVITTNDKLSEGAWPILKLFALAPEC